MAITAFLSRSPGLLNRGPGGLGAWGPSLSGTYSTFQHLLSKWSDLQLTDFLSSPGLYNCSTSTFFLWASQLHSFNPSTVKVISWYSSTGCTVIYTGAFTILTAWPGSLCYTFSFLSRGIILWIELPRPENPMNINAWHTETLDSCFDLIRSYQQCIP